MVLVANLGLHLKANYSAAISHFTAVYTQMNAALRPFRLIWRETSPQHFPTPHGWYELSQLSNQSEASKTCDAFGVNCKDRDERREGCVPVRHSMAAEHDWYNELAQPHIAQLPATSVIKVCAAASSQWYEHFGYGNVRAGERFHDNQSKFLDCTHFCISGSGVLHHWAAELVGSVTVEQDLEYGRINALHNIS